MSPPNLFIVGAPRCGTTSMTRYLIAHGDITRSRPNEPLFHAKDLPAPKAVTDRDEYLAIFDGNDAEYRMDGSTWYLYSAEAAASIAEMSPDARIIIQLRDPCDFITSLHTHHCFVGLEPEPDLERAVFDERRASGDDFRRNLDYLAAARFATQIERFTALFPRDHIQFLLLGELAGDPRATHLAVLRFLDVPAVPLSDYGHFNTRRRRRNDRVTRLATTLGRPGAARWRRSAAARIDRLNTVEANNEAPRELRRRIIDELEPEIHRVEKLIDRDLSSWRVR